VKKPKKVIGTLTFLFWSHTLAYCVKFVILAPKSFMTSAAGRTSTERRLKQLPMDEGSMTSGRIIFSQMKLDQIK
jgi:hypothetical protein